jgi:hypothetical protein
LVKGIFKISKGSDIFFSFSHIFFPFSQISQVDYNNQTNHSYNWIIVLVSSFVNFVPTFQVCSLFSIRVDN